ncbi:MAG: antibiotic biosynthesis monooxygenase [Streptosporangiales bacterium]|nr:antibiotic biosynthesis monooxygenase [Streptosporangiales bacterium]
MLAVTKHTVSAADEAGFLERAGELVDALRPCHGHVATKIARAADEPSQWLIVSEWENVGSYRRALSAYDVRVRAVPLLATAHDEPSAYEVLLDTETGSRSSDRAQ